mmetsp:Transcript_23235/g.55055  ORF Transcript_23235/g.55055 Transcript_23235/m.55055 type:complete len:421 (-) Transcript_23235:49-1311(-)
MAAAASSSRAAPHTTGRPSRANGPPSAGPAPRSRKGWFKPGRTSSSRSWPRGSRASTGAGSTLSARQTAVASARVKVASGRSSKRSASSASSLAWGTLSMTASAAICRPRCWRAALSQAPALLALRSVARPSGMDSIISLLLSPQLRLSVVATRVQRLGLGRLGEFAAQLLADLVDRVGIAEPALDTQLQPQALRIELLGLLVDPLHIEARTFQLVVAVQDLGQVDRDRRIAGIELEGTDQRLLGHEIAARAGLADALDQQRARRRPVARLRQGLVEQRIGGSPAFLLADEPAVVVQGVGVIRIDRQRTPEGLLRELVFAHRAVHQAAHVHRLAHVGLGLQGLLELVQRRRELAAREIALGQLQADGGTPVRVGLVGIGPDFAVGRGGRAGAGAGGQQQGKQDGQGSLHRILRSGTRAST